VTNPALHFILCFRIAHNEKQTKTSPRVGGGVAQVKFPRPTEAQAIGFPGKVPEQKL
jgi:hypothetical protein